MTGRRNVWLGVTLVLFSSLGAASAAESIPFTDASVSSQMVVKYRRYVLDPLKCVPEADYTSCNEAGTCFGSFGCKVNFVNGAGQQIRNLAGELYAGAESVNLYLSGLNGKIPYTTTYGETRPVLSPATTGYRIYLGYFQSFPKDKINDVLNELKPIAKDFIEKEIASGGATRGVFVLEPSTGGVDVCAMAKARDKRSGALSYPELASDTELQKACAQ